jgi:hypothetical protein
MLVPRWHAVGTVGKAVAGQAGLSPGVQGLAVLRRGLPVLACLFSSVLIALQVNCHPCVISILSYSICLFSQRLLVDWVGSSGLKFGF